MRKADSDYVIESPNDALHDVFYDASEDSANFHAVIVPNALGLGGFGFVIRRNETDAENFAVSEFEFGSESEAREYLEGQLPFVEVGPR